jgi:hypothetical protein
LRVNVANNLLALIHHLDHLVLGELNRVKDFLGLLDFI